MPKKRGHGQGALYYLPSKKMWRGVAELPEEARNGKKRAQKYVHAKSQTECRRKLEELLEEIDTHGMAVDRSVTVAQWSQTWLEDHARPHVDPSTYAGYASAVRKWINPTIGHKKVATLKPSDVIEVHKALRTAGRATSTARGAHIVMSRSLEQARRQGLCRRNVADDVDPPGGRGKAAGKRRKRNRDSLPLTQAANILTAARDDDRGSLWWLKLLGGPRQTEGLGTLLEDYDRDAGVIYVNWKLEEVTKAHGCGVQRGGEWPCGRIRGSACPDGDWRIPDDFEYRHIVGRWCLTRPKSVVGREIPLIPQHVDLIDAYLERHRDEPNPHGLLWRKSDGMPYFKKEDSQEWRNLLHRAGVITADQTAPGKSPVDGHMARHTTVTLLASLNVDFHLIGEIVGHSTEEVTKIYRHARLEEKRAAVQLLGDLVLPSGRPAIEA